MIARMLDQADEDLEHAFDHYQAERIGLGLEDLEEFRHGIDRLLEHPLAWKPLDATYRRYRLVRFPYGIVYRVDGETVWIVAVMHMSRSPGYWKH